MSQFTKTALSLCLISMMGASTSLSANEATKHVQSVSLDDGDTPIESSDDWQDMSASGISTIERIEQKLKQADTDGYFYQVADVEYDDTSREDEFAKIEQGDISLIDGGQTPIGLDEVALSRLPTYEQMIVKINDEQGQVLDIDGYLPDYQYEEQFLPDLTSHEVDELKKPSLIRRSYNRLFKDGVETVERLKVNFYQGGERLAWDVAVSDLDDFAKLRTRMEQKQQQNLKATDNAEKIPKSVLNTEPFANIRHALQEIEAGSVLDFRESMARLRQTVVSAARAVGYYDISFSIERQGAGEIDLVMHDVGKPVMVDVSAIDVRGQGADDPMYANAVANAPLGQGEVFHHGKYEMTKNLINDTSGEHGYFDGRWLNHSVDVVLPDNVADVNLVYDTGEQYLFDEVVFFTIDPDTHQLTANPDKLPVKPEVLRKLVMFNMGEAYNRTAVRNLSSNLLATGYFNAVNTEVVFPSQNEERIVFEGLPSEADTGMAEVVDLGEGVVATIDPIDFTTSELISDKLSLVKQKAEQLYQAPDDRLLVVDSSAKSKSILGRISDAVSSVAKMILPDESSDVLPMLAEGEEPPVLAGRKQGEEVYQDKKVPLYIFVLSDKPRDAQIGVGWGSDNGARLLTKVEHHLLNRDGMQAGLDTSISQKTKGVEAYITRPMLHPLNDKLKASLGYSDEKINQGVGNFKLSSQTLQTGISRNIIKENGWNRTYSLRYRLDKLHTQAPRETWQDLPVKFESGRPTQEALLLGYAMNKIKADNLANPMRGYRQYYSLELAKDGLLADTDMAILRAGLSGVYSFGDNIYGTDRKHQLIGSVNMGYLWADDFNGVPYKLRFFAGGDQSIRGYNYDSLSPLSDKGYLMGGQALAVASTEYNYEVLEGLRLALFSDVGNAYDENFKNDTKIGAGVGVRYASPVGQVRLDIATGINEPDTAIKLHFFIGSPFR